MKFLQLLSLMLKNAFHFYNVTAAPPVFLLKTSNTPILKNMVEIITQAPNKSRVLARYQALQIRQAKETATQITTSVLKNTFVSC